MKTFRVQIDGEIEAEDIDDAVLKLALHLLFGIGVDLPMPQIFFGNITIEPGRETTSEE